MSWLLRTAVFSNYAFKSSGNLLRPQSLLGFGNILPDVAEPAPLVRMRVRRHPERRRTLKPMSWWRKKKTNMLNNSQDLTSENRQFLSEAVAEYYKPIVTSTSPLKEAPWARGQWEESDHSVRTGVLAIKLGCCTQWTDNGDRIITTMLQVLDNHVVGYIPPEEFAKSPRYKSRHWGEGYGCQIVGALSCDPHMFNPSYLDLFKESGVPPKRKLTRFLVTPNAAVQPGTPLYAAHFRPGDFVNVQAKTIGHGFQGVMKRWNIGGGAATHGNTKSHRRMGSLAAPSMWGHVWKGRRMPGHMGVQWRTQRGLKVWRVNPEYNVIYVHGAAVPGPVHSYVRIMDSTFWKHFSVIDKKNPPPFPTFYPSEKTPLSREDLYDKSLFKMDQPTITYKVDLKEEKRQRMLMAKSAKADTLATRRGKLLDKIKAIESGRSNQDSLSENPIQHHVSTSALENSAGLSQRFGSRFTQLSASGLLQRHNVENSSSSETESPEILNSALKPHHFQHPISKLTTQSKDPSIFNDSPKDLVKSSEEPQSIVSGGQHARQIQFHGQGNDEVPIRGALLPEARSIPPHSATQQKYNPQHSHLRENPVSHFSPFTRGPVMSRPKSACILDKENIQAKSNLSSMNRSHNASHGSGEKTSHESHRETSAQPIPLPPPPSHHNDEHAEKKNETQSNQHQPDEKQSSSVMFNQLRIGRNNYRVLRHIGSGGFSNVFSVVSETDGKQYALKQVRVPSEHHLADAMREADLLRTLADTGCVVRVFEVAAVRKKNSALMILMELGNADLTSWMKSLSKSPPHLPAFIADPDLCKSLFKQMARAIGLLHSRGIVHNDLKPSNWLFTNGCRLKLIDFGVSRQLAVDKTSQVELDKLCGTLDYMSPERLSDARTSPAGDVWALGCIFHELAFGSAPFAHLSAAVQKITAIAAWPQEFSIPFTPKDYLHESCGKVTTNEPHLVSLIRCCLQKAPKSRPTANDILQHPFLSESKQSNYPSGVSVADACSVLRNAASHHAHGDERRHFVSQVLDYLLGNSQNAPQQ